MSGFTRSEAVLMEFVTSFPHQAAFMSLKDLCQATHTSKPKVIEFYKKLGYTGYKNFLEGVKGFYEHHIDSYRASTITFKKIKSIDELLQAAIQIDIKALSRMAGYISTDDLLQSARSILDAERIYIFSPGTGYYPGHFLYERLKRYRLDTHLVGNDAQHLAEEIYPMDKNDLLLVFHYFPESKIFEGVMRLAKDAGATVILITGSIYLNLVSLSNKVLFINRGDIEFKNSMAVPMTFANLLLLTVELLGGEDVKKELKYLEEKRDRYALAYFS